MAVFQVRPSSHDGLTGNWSDLTMIAESLDDIKAAVCAHPRDEEAYRRCPAYEIAEIVRGWIGQGPMRNGTPYDTWDEIDFGFMSLEHDVLKISYYTGGRGRDHEIVERRGYITFMPGN